MPCQYGHTSIANGSGFDGCYASHILIRSGTTVIRLPDSISDGLAASINCALATMVNCVDNLPDSVKRSKKKALVQVIISTSKINKLRRVKNKTSCVVFNNKRVTALWARTDAHCSKSSASSKSTAWASTKADFRSSNNSA